MSFKQMYFIFFKIGLFTFGGGYAMIPMIKRVIADQKKLIHHDVLTDYIAVAQAAPGMIALNIAHLVGRHLRGMKGAIAAILGVVTPSFLIIVIIASILTRFIEYEIVEYALYGVLMSVVILLMFAVIDILKVIMSYQWLILYAFMITGVVTLFSIHIGFTILSAFILGSIHTYFKSKGDPND